MGADPRLLRHGMAHQSADPAIAIGERMDPVEPVVCRSHRQDALSLAHPDGSHTHPVFRLESKPRVEVRDEIGDPARRRRKMPANLDVVLVARAPLSRGHMIGPPSPAHSEHRLGCASMEVAM